MTPDQLDALLAYIDARIREKIDIAAQGYANYPCLRPSLEDALRDVFKEEGESK